MKILYVGNLNKGYRVLKELLSVSGLWVEAVITSPVKEDTKWNMSVRDLAEAHDVDVYTPADINDKTFCQMLRERYDFDLGLSNGSGGKLYKEAFFSIPKNCFLNIHFSYLPRYRGAYPVPHAIMNDEREHGVTIHKIDAGMDTGNIILQEKVPIFEADRGMDLYTRCEDLAVVLVRELFFRNATIATATYGSVSQDESRVLSYKRKDISPSLLPAPLEKGSRALYNFVRAWDFPAYKRPAYLELWQENELKRYYLALNPLDYGFDHGECRYLTYKDYKIFMMPESLFEERTGKWLMDN